jgi:ATP-binding protein involved in chromosome partitioning
MTLATGAPINLNGYDLFLAEDKTPVVWNGPNAETFLWRGTMEMHTLREFLSDVQWGALDILLLDLPPGAERVSTIRDLLPDLHGTVVVTIPSAVSHLVVLKSITLARDLLHTPVLGLVENMTSYVCPTCEQVHPLFGPTSPEEMPLGVPLLGRIPFDPRMAAAGDRGTQCVDHAARTLQRRVGAGTRRGNGARFLQGYSRRRTHADHPHR